MQHNEHLEPTCFYVKMLLIENSILYKLISECLYPTDFPCSPVVSVVHQVCVLFVINNSTHKEMHTDIHPYTNTNTHTGIHTDANTHTHTHTHTSTHTHTHTHRHAHKHYFIAHVMFFIKTGLNG